MVALLLLLPLLVVLLPIGVVVLFVQYGQLGRRRDAAESALAESRRREAGA